MKTLILALLHRNIYLQSEPIIFSQLVLVGLVDYIIHLCCTSMYHASYYLKELAFTDLGSWKMIVRVDSLIMTYSHDMPAIHSRALL